MDPGSGALTGLSHRALRAHHTNVERQAQDETRDAGRSGDPDEDGPEVEQELFLQQLETGTVPCRTLADLRREICSARRAAVDAAAGAGAAAVAVAVPVLVDEQADVTPKARYEEMVQRFGDVARQAMTCGMHVHVDVDSDDEAVAVLDRIRPWLPVLLGLSANSPFYQGADTGYESWRSQMWTRWPSAGQVEPFGSAAGYSAAVEDLIASGAAMDRGMLYFDARPAVSYPTLEIRVADVCTDIEDALVVAVLARGLVETAARSWRAAEPTGTWRAELLRAATWRAGRDGLSGELIDPTTRRPAPAATVVKSLLAHIREAVDDAGETDVLAELVDQMLSRGTGAARQRGVFAASGSIRAVVEDLRVRTAESCGRAPG